MRWARGRENADTTPRLRLGSQALDSLSGVRRMRVRTTLLVGLAVREAFSFWTGHPFDFETWVRIGYWVTRGLSPYHALPLAPGVSFANDFSASSTADVGYLPFWPLLLAGIYELYSLVGFGDRFVYYFLIKQPIILGDVLLAYLIYAFVERQKPGRGTRPMALWLFSPFTIILSGIWGMFDSMAMAAVMIALLAPPGKARAAWEGAAILVKSIPVLFVPPFLNARAGRVANLLVAVAVPVLTTLIVLAVAGWPLSSFGATLGSTLGKAGIPLSLWGTWDYLNTIGVVSSSTFGAALSWGGYLWVPAVVAASFLAWKWFGFSTERDVVRSSLVVILVFLLVRAQVNEQYAVYLLAFLLVEASLWSPARMRLFYAFSAVIVAVVVTNNFLMIRFLSPIDPNALSLENNLLVTLGGVRNAALYLEGLIFTALNLWYLYALVKERGSRGLA